MTMLKAGGILQVWLLSVFKFFIVFIYNISKQNAAVRLDMYFR